MDDTNLNFAVIDKPRKKVITIQLEDEQGDTVDFKELVSEISLFVKEQMNGTDANPTIQQIFPLAGQSLVHSLPQFASKNEALLFLASDRIKHNLLNQIITGMYIFKFIQSNNLKIVTMEEDITDEEIEKQERISHFCSTMTAAYLGGFDMQTTVEKMIDNGSITQEEITSLGLDFFGLGDYDASEPNKDN